MANEALKQCISMPIQPGKKARSSFMHYPNGEMEELTASPLYHTVTIINSNIHSSGVSLQLTKERKYIISQNQLFLLKCGLLLKRERFY